MVCCTDLYNDNDCYVCFCLHMYLILTRGYATVLNDCWFMLSVLGSRSKISEKLNNTARLQKGP